MSLFTEKQLVDNLFQGDKKAFSTIFSLYYKDLVLFANSFTRNTDISEEIVQEVFVKLWENRIYIQIQISLKSYLIKVTQNKCLDWLKHQKVIEHYRNVAPQFLSLSENNTDNYLLYSELSDKLDSILETFPPEVSETFRLNRFSGLKNYEIAEKMNVSVRTVESRVSKALQLLKEALKDYMGLFLTFLLTQKF